jgi:transposase, IS30 family
LDKEYSLRGIATALSRGVSSISEEISKNSVNGIYDPKKAHAKFLLRRKDSKYQGMKIVMDKDLRIEVDELLLDNVCPTNISGRIAKLHKQKKKISKDSVYRYLDSAYAVNIQEERKKKQNKRRKRAKLSKLKERRNISERPEIANRRGRFGDIEMDFIVSGKNGHGILLVMVDRKTRRAFIRKITVITVNNVHKTLLEIQKLFPEIKTLTTDNDLLFQKHKELEILLKRKIYFCNAYHSWEKGSVENANKYIRKFIPKGSDISKYSDAFIQDVEDRLNRRPMEVLGFSTPKELFDRYQFKKK